jgi:hypothetical protein
MRDYTTVLKLLWNLCYHEQYVVGRDTYPLS